MAKLATHNSSDLSEVELLPAATGSVGVWGKIKAYFGESGLVAIGATLAVIFGIILKAASATDPIFLRVLGLPGRLWLDGLKLVVLPMIFTNMVTSVGNLKDLPEAGRMGARTICFYLVTTVCAALIGVLMVGIFIVPNVTAVNIAALPSSLTSSYAKTSSTSLNQNLTVFDGVENILLGMVPANIVAAAATNNLMGVIFFGTAIGMYVEKGGHLMHLCEEFNQVMLSLVEVLVRIAPLGVFSLVAPKIASFDLSQVAQYLGLYLGAVFTGLFIHAIFVYPTIYFVLLRKNPFAYLRNILPAMVTALSTSSSAATLPVTINCATKQNGVSKDVANFVLSLGATINMDGTAISFPIAVVFLSYVQGLSMTASQLITTVLVSSVSSMGAAPVPNSGLVMLVIIMEAVGVPLNGTFGLILVVDWLTDRPCTMVNIMGDSIAAAFIQKFARPLPTADGLAVTADRQEDVATGAL